LRVTAAGLALRLTVSAVGPKKAGKGGKVVLPIFAARYRLYHLFHLFPTQLQKMSEGKNRCGRALGLR